MNDDAVTELWHALLGASVDGFETEPRGYESPVYNTYSDTLVRWHKKSADDLTDHVYNPVCGFATVFDTACAAASFATEFERTRQPEWRQRAKRALNAVENWGVYNGVDEPRWDPVGWHFHAGSLSVTGTVLDAAWETMSILDVTHPVDGRWGRLCEYLEQCRHGTGRFAHNTIPGDAAAWDVQNTTAFALYLMSHEDHDASSADYDVRAQSDAAISHLYNGQRPDGFWPYIYPSRVQKALYRFWPLRPVFEDLMIGGDSSIFFGDISHQCYTLYFLLKSVTAGNRVGNEERIRSGWEWLRRRLVETEDGGIRIEYEWEPEIERVRYANVGDTTAYFLILSMLPKLANLGIVDTGTVERTATGLVTHVMSNLLEPDDLPIITPHEKSRKERRHVLPAVWWSSSMKASLFAEFLREYDSGELLTEGRLGR